MVPTKPPPALAPVWQKKYNPNIAFDAHRHILTVTDTSSDQPHPPSRWAAKYWPTQLGLIALRVLIRLPYRWQLSLGRTIGKLLYLAGGRRRKIARINISLCFPERSPQEQEALVREHFASLGISLFEMVMAWRAPDKKLQPLLDVQGLEHVEHALTTGHGVILLSAHFTTLEIGGRLLALARGKKFNALYRPHKNPVFEQQQSLGRESQFANPIPRDDMRQMVKRLKNGEIIWYAPDQNYGHKHSVFADFFGIAAATNTTTSRLARMTGAAVIPYFPQRKADGSGYTVTLLAPLEDFPGASVEADAQRMNDLFATAIRTMPEQYLWVHRRFKDRPDNEPRFY